MEIKAFFGLLASVFIVIGSIPYLIDIHHKSAKPHILSWLGWSLITALGAFAMLAEGSTWSVTIIWANTVMCLVIAIYAIVKKAGVWSTTIYDYILFSLGILGLILWQALDMPILALICAIGAFAFYDAAYPIYLFMYDATMLLLVTRIIKNRKLKG